MNTERAAEVMGRARELSTSSFGWSVPRDGFRYLAQALADAGLLISDVDRAVLDAADGHERYHKSRQDSWCNCVVCVAVRARRETRP